jgi:hypothetical protein
VESNQFSRSWCSRQRVQSQCHSSYNWTVITIGRMAQESSRGIRSKIDRPCR